MLTPAQIQERLEGIEADLAERQEAYEQAAEDYHRLTRDFDLKVAQVKTASKAKTETAKKDEALVAIAASDDSLYADFKDAEARFMALKAAISTMDKRAMIGMGLLKSHGREPATVPQREPAWSTGRRAA